MKRSLLIVLALCLLLPMGTVRGQSVGTFWACSVDNRDDVNALCISAPGPGMRLYITDVIGQSTNTSAGLFQIVHNQSVATGGSADCGGVATGAVFPPVIEVARFAAAANTAQATSVNLAIPLSIPTGRDLCIYGDATNPVTVQLSGYIAP